MSLVIRQEQMDSLQAEMVSEFEGRMVVYLPQTFPDQLGATSESDLRSMIRKGIEKAESYGVVLEMDVQRYLESLVVLGSDFDEGPEHEWAGKILDDASLSGTQKMDSIDNHLIFAQEV